MQAWNWFLSYLCLKHMLTGMKYFQWDCILITIFLFPLYLFLMCICCAYVSVYAMTQVWGLEENPQESVLSSPSGFWGSNSGHQSWAPEVSLRINHNIFMWPDIDFSTMVSYQDRKGFIFIYNFQIREPSSLAHSYTLLLKAPSELSLLTYIHCIKWQISLEHSQVCRMGIWSYAPTLCPLLFLLAPVGPLLKQSSLDFQVFFFFNFVSIYAIKM